MIDIITLLFSIPGALLALLDLSEKLHKQPKRTFLTKDDPCTSAMPYSPTAYTDIEYENKKFLLQIVSFISLGIATFLTILEFHNIKTPPTMLDSTMLFPWFPVFINKLLLSLYHSTDMFLVLLIGLSAFSIFHHINSKVKEKVHFITYVIFFSSSIFLNLLWGKISFSDLELLFRMDTSSGILQSFLISFIPYCIFITTLLVYAAILQLVHMLYLPKLSNIYLKEQLKKIAYTFLIPFLLTLLTIYWAYLLWQYIS